MNANEISMKCETAMGKCDRGVCCAGTDTGSERSDKLTRRRQHYHHDRIGTMTAMLDLTSPSHVVPCFLSVISKPTKLVAWLAETGESQIQLLGDEE